MDKRFLDKVVDQIMSETRIDYDTEVIYPPSFFSLPLSYFYISTPSHFTKHCREVYGLSNEEIGYVWDEYKDIVKDKIRNNGL